MNTAMTPQNRPASTGSTAVINLADHIVNTNLPPKNGETVAQHADRLLMQAFYPRAGMNEAELARLERAHKYIQKLADRFAVQIIRMSTEELRATHCDIANIFNVNPRSRELAA